MWVTHPQINFFCCHNPDAETVFEIVGASIAATLRSLGYRSFSVVMTYAGYGYLDCVPVVIAVAKSFVHADAEHVQSRFYRTNRQYLQEIFLYNGITEANMDDNPEFKKSQPKPDCGYSIGPGSDIAGAGPTTSFSLGVYFKVKGDASGTVYATTVGHGIRRDIGPLQRHIAPIPIEQPSKSDVARSDKQYAKKGYPPHVRHRPTTRF
jgi:hypothetical protein